MYTEIRILFHHTFLFILALWIALHTIKFNRYLYIRTDMVIMQTRSSRGRVIYTGRSKLTLIPTDHGRNQAICECQMTTAGRNRVNRGVGEGFKFLSKSVVTKVQKMCRHGGGGIEQQEKNC